jgi:hypothetical protein
VVFIVGTGRSGSTVVSKVLGSTPGFFAGGEVRYIWERGLLEGRVCSCGEPIDACPVWHRVLDEAFEGRDIDVERIARLARAAVRIRALPELLWRGRRNGLDDDTREYLAILDRLYAAVSRVTGSVLVDSSKLPAYAYLLDRIPSLDLRVLHLVRDPRASAFSWTESAQRHGTRVETDPMDTFPPAKSAALWDLWNGVTLGLWSRTDRYLRVRYEDFVAHPRATAAQIVAFAGGAADQLPFVDDHTARIELDHLVAGNPNRSTTGLLTVREDDEWRRSMPRSARRSVAAITLPLMTTFGYAPWGS